MFFFCVCISWKQRLILELCTISVGESATMLNYAPRFEYVCWSLDLNPWILALCTPPTVTLSSVHEVPPKVGPGDVINRSKLLLVPGL